MTEKLKKTQQKNKQPARIYTRLHQNIIRNTRHE